MATTMDRMAVTGAQAEARVSARVARHDRGEALTLHGALHALLLVVGAATLVVLLVGAFFALSGLVLTIARDGMASLVPSPELPAVASSADTLASALRLLLMACGCLVVVGVMGIAHALLRPAPSSRR